MDRIPATDPMETPPHPPLAGLDPADLLRQGAAEDTFVDGAATSFNPPSIEELATIFPQFEILGLIGKGGMGAVYKVRQKDLDRTVALKILPPDIGQSPESSNRFTREAKALAKLNHPGIVTLHEFGQQDGLYFILMEFVDGVNLAQLMGTSRISPREALAIVPQICDALQFAHDQGIVHRDIKPENILLDRMGRVKVADFGIAKVVAAVCEDPLRSGDTPVPTDQTFAGKILGTPQYMAPEQIDHPSEVDHRADIYALGVVFYQMLTGELPGNDLQSPSRMVHIDVRLDEIVLQAMEKNPELRYQQARVMKTRVEAITRPKSNDSSDFPVSNNIKPRAWRLALVAVAHLLLVYGITSFGIELFRMREAPEWHRITMLFTLNQGNGGGILTDSLKQSLQTKDSTMTLAKENRDWKLSFVATSHDLTQNARRAAQEKLVQSFGESLRFLETTSVSSQVSNGGATIGPYWTPYFRKSVFITMLGLAILSFSQPLNPEKRRYHWAGKAGVRCLLAVVLLPWLVGFIGGGYALGLLAHFIPLGLAVTFALISWESRIGWEVMLGAGLLFTFWIFQLSHFIDLSGIPVSQGTPGWIAAIASMVIVGLHYLAKRQTPRDLGH